jgi:hypothetical protein
MMIEDLLIYLYVGMLAAVLICASISIPFQFLRDFLSKKLFAAHRLDLLHKLSRQGAHKFEFAFNPIAKTAVLGQFSPVIFDIAGMTKWRLTVKTLWLINEIAEHVMMALFLLLFLVSVAQELVPETLDSLLLRFL